ncbi:hypothetical protein [Dyadobacter sp. CY326]|uniref:hypothetical protein n=1 Tax=Dyadobacter sp. CY326 TaxID=2907300 RepID=UPI001F36FE56|nr:hypothetical protein [Dyadobacter sp. CY326]MCE7066149.1 hypothetical protein [Dyadobacter sp. CY326]
MKSSDTSTITLTSEAVQTAKSLRTLYFTRAAFSLIWVLLVTSFASKTNPSLSRIRKRIKR